MIISLFLFLLPPQVRHEKQVINENRLIFKTCLHINFEETKLKYTFGFHVW